MQVPIAKDILNRHESLLKPLLTIKADEVKWGNVRETECWKNLLGRKNDSEDTIETDHDAASMGPAYIPAESTVRNDYSQHFIDTGGRELPGNAVGNPYRSSRFEEYPKLKRLIEVKSAILASISHPPFYLQADLFQSLEAPTTGAGHPIGIEKYFHLSTLMPIKFDVVIVDPPLECYEWESVPSGGDTASQAWSWDQVAALPIPQIMAKESFIFLWVGSGASDGLERGREALMKWGYRRCEDIVWVQTNDDQATNVQRTGSSCFAKSVQHCLMGIRGTVRRSNDTRFVHCNIDTDVLLWPGERQNGGTAIDTRCKPPEMMDIAENFCLGTRRLELFGSNRNLRRGWLTIGKDVGPDAKNWMQCLRGENSCAMPATQSEPRAYHKAMYDSYFGVDRAGCTLAERANLVPYNEEVEVLRPKSPSAATNRINQGRSRAPQQQMPHQALSPNYIFNPMTPPLYYGHGSMSPNLSTFHAGGAGISGLGAGGASVVSVPSGSEMLSGAQATVLMGQSSNQYNRLKQPSPYLASSDGSPAL